MARSAAAQFPGLAAVPEANADEADRYPSPMGADPEGDEEDPEDEDETDEADEEDAGEEDPGPRPIAADREAIFACEDGADIAFRCDVSRGATPYVYAARFRAPCSWSRVVNALQAKGLILPGETRVRIARLEMVQGKLRTTNSAVQTLRVQGEQSRPINAQASPQGPAAVAVDPDLFGRLVRALEKGSAASPAPAPAAGGNFAREVVVPLAVALGPTILTAWLQRPSAIEQMRPILAEVVELARGAGRGDAAGELAERFDPVLERLASAGQSAPTNWGELVAACAPMLMAFLAAKSGIPLQPEAVASAPAPAVEPAPVYPEIPQMVPEAEGE